VKLEKVSVKNFRCYQDEVSVEVDDLVALVGRNDAGKTTILEALEIFFNNDAVKIEPGDANVHNTNKVVSITCSFSDYPPTLAIDATADTSLEEEYLLDSNNQLTITKKFDCAKKTPKEETFIIAQHPTNAGFSNLHELKEKELQAKIKELDLDVPLKGNPGMRKALWAACEDLTLHEKAIPITKEDGRRIWDQIEKHLPMYALFQSDRNSRDSDGEVQNPLRAAITAALAEVEDEIREIQNTVRDKVEGIAARTYEALQTIAPELAKELSPEFSEAPKSKWTGLFSVSMNTDEGIPLNKRGSGVRRLILVSFFRAEAERRMEEARNRGIIYAIEEPETAQHPANQKILLDAFKTLAQESGCQVLLTTHSPEFASELPAASLRFVTIDERGTPVVEIGENMYPAIADNLGIMHGGRVRALICVEGPTDVSALKYLSSALHAEDPSIPDLTTDSRIAFVVLGGGTLKHWVAEHYLRNLELPEFHIYDRDVKSYEHAITEVQKRKDGSQARQTRKLEMENYLHPEAVKEAFGFTITIEDENDVPKGFGRAWSRARGHGDPMGPEKSKLKLANKAFRCMTAERILNRDPDEEVKGWLKDISTLLDE
jgi:putative ATP-dependent endonuclease of OLD family